jgi:hypothetical protein
MLFPTHADILVRCTMTINTGLELSNPSLTKLQMGSLKNLSKIGSISKMRHPTERYFIVGSLFFTKHDPFS